MTATRYEGKLVKWNAERGFGFILAQDSGQDVFVHISAFPRDGRLPVVDELLSFEVQADGQGKKRAVQVRRAGDAAPAPAPRTAAAVRMRRTPAKSTSVLGTLLILLLLVAVSWYGYSRYTTRLASPRPGVPAGEFATPTTLLPGSKLAVPPDFRCDGRKHCSQMSSCREATLFLQNCPGMEMDGNHDGVPCEQQWCR